MKSATDQTRSNQAGARFGFTLVELLVVIGIIALLVSVLLPTLARAREGAQRAACLSNLRQIAQMFHIYADNNKGQIVLGVRSNVYQDNYTIRYTAAGEYYCWGAYYKSGLAKDPKFLYCPSSGQDIFHEYNGANNPWKPDAQGELTSYTRAGYGLRPMNYDGRPILWRTTTPEPIVDPVVDGSYPTNPNGVWSPYPKLDKFRIRAIASDIFATKHRVIWRHKKGINVAYADGSARWYDTQPFNKLPTTWTVPTGANNWGTPNVSTLPVAVWNDLSPAAQNFVDPLTGGGNGMMASCWELLDRDAGATPNPKFVYPP